MVKKYLSVKLPVAQVAPKNEDVQVHVNDCPLLVQVPPFKHGLLAQELSDRNSIFNEPCTVPYL